MFTSMAIRSKLVSPKISVSPNGITALDMAATSIAIPGPKMKSILFALAGGISALLLRGYYFNVSGGVGFVSIFGISVMAGVILVSALNRAVLNSQVNQLAINAVAKEQLRAILSILVLAILGLIPAAVSTGIGSDVQRPLATVIIGGLLSTLIFTPLLIPPLFYWVKQSQQASNEVGGQNKI